MTTTDQENTMSESGGQRYVVQFSGGMGSWGAARWVRDEMGVDPADMTLLFADTNGEDPDLYRFLDEAARDIGAELVTLDNDGQTIWDVFRKKRMIGNNRLSVCSRVLKQEPCREWMTSNTEPDATTIVVGIDWTEIHRLPAIERNWSPWPVLAPLAAPTSYHRHDLPRMLADVGIKRPRMYEQGFPHNNCAGACVRAGQGQWASLLRLNPTRYAEEEAQEEAFRAEIGKDVAILRDRRGGTSKPLPLRVLRERIEAEGLAQIDLFDIGGCGCMTDDMTTEGATR